MLIAIKQYSKFLASVFYLLLQSKKRRKKNQSRGILSSPRYLATSDGKSLWSYALMLNSDCRVLLKRQLTLSNLQMIPTTRRKYFMTNAC